MELADTILTLFFTERVGLKTWADIGSIDRELAIYKKLSRYLKKVDMVSMGAAKTEFIQGKLEIILSFCRLRGTQKRSPFFIYC